MNSFSADWLALREPLDAVSRAAGLAPLRPAAAAVQARDTPLKIIDLGSGTGANLRYAAPLLGGVQEWLLVEHDPLLIDATQVRMQAWSHSVHTEGFECRFQSLALDLADQLDELPLCREVLLTASALLDLVSEHWLRALIGRAADAAATLWFTLTYDGRIDCHPAEAEDPEVRELCNLHQRGDKGFGIALGATAATVAGKILGEHGYRQQCAPSDWCVGSDQAALQFALVEGWFEAACEIAPARTTALRAWRARRRAHIEAGRSTLRVGHVDMVGWPGRLHSG